MHFLCRDLRANGSSKRPYAPEYGRRPGCSTFDVPAKLQQLGQLLQQNIKEWKITEAQIQRELMSGNLQQTINSMNPEAGQLLDEINASMKNSPNADNLPDLLGDLMGHTQ